jgi:Tfp pilus assembly protein PilE
MYISPRATLVRNFSVSLFNGIITLVILLIAPLGIVAVIINILLTTIVTYIVTTVRDRVVTFLQRNDQPAEFLSN